MQFGLRHPDRTLGLMLISTGLETVEESEVPESGSIMMLLTDMFMWASAKISPSLLMSTLSDGFDASDPDQAAQAKELAETLVPVRMRWEGNVNDAVQFTNPAMNDWPLSEITVPTLIVHGDRDPLASYEGALTMADRFSNARLVTIKDGGHAGFNSEQQSLFANATAEFIQSLTQISE